MKKSKTSFEDFLIRAFAHIKRGKYTMDGLSNQQMEKIWEMMRNIKSQRYNYLNEDLKLVAELLRNVSPRTALVLYTCAWSYDFEITENPSDRDELIRTAMFQTFNYPTMPATITRSTYCPSSLMMWYTYDKIDKRHLRIQ